MKLLITPFLFLALTSAALAAPDKSELDARIHKLAVKLDTMQAKADKRIPPETLRKAYGVVLLDRTKVGIGLGFQTGSGLAMVRDAKSKKWSPPAFFHAAEGSLGAQLGGQQSFVVILLMNTNAIRMLTDGNFKFGGDASGSAGNAAGGAEGTTSKLTPLTMVYGDTSGFFGGAAVKGDNLTSDVTSDATYYGQSITANEILLQHKVKATPAATELMKKLDQFSKGK